MLLGRWRWGNFKSWRGGKDGNREKVQVWWTHFMNSGMNFGCRKRTASVIVHVFTSMSPNTQIMHKRILDLTLHTDNKSKSVSSPYMMWKVSIHNDNKIPSGMLYAVNVGSTYRQNTIRLLPYLDSHVSTFVQPTTKLLYGKKLSQENQEWWNSLHLKKL